MTAPTTPAPEVVGYRYGRPGAARVGHLLPAGWAEEPAHRGAAALCGTRSSRWQPVHALPKAADFVDCTACTDAAGIVRPEAPTTRIAPSGRRAHGDVTPVRTADRSTQAVRTARRAAPFVSIPLAPEAHGYVPMDAELRVQTYYRMRGVADGWPIPLMRCTPPFES